MSERVVFRNSKGLNLVGILEPVKTDKIAILAHGFTSGKDRPKFVKTAEALSAVGIASLRFDFAGSGESDNREITVAGQLDDLKSAIDFCRKMGYSKIGLLGSSLGGLICILAYDDKICAMVLLAPVTKAKTPGEFKDPARRKEIEEKGYVILHKDDREFKVGKDYVVQREKINQQEILSKIKCPVLIIHGDNDVEVPLEHSKSAMDYLPPSSRLEIFKGGSHRLEEDLNRLARLSTDWFKKYL